MIQQSEQHAHTRTRALIQQRTCSTGTHIATLMKVPAYFGSGAPPLMNSRMRPPTAAW
jgi:hypothetical protein